MYLGGKLNLSVRSNEAVPHSIPDPDIDPHDPKKRSVELLPFGGIEKRLDFAGGTPVQRVSVQSPLDQVRPRFWSRRSDQSGPDGFFVGIPDQVPNFAEPLGVGRLPSGVMASGVKQ